MRQSWPIEKAKGRLSEVVDQAMEHGAQILTRRGEEVAVVLSLDDYREFKKKRIPLSEFFGTLPWKLSTSLAIGAPRGVKTPRSITSSLTGRDVGLCGGPGPHTKARDRIRRDWARGWSVAPGNVPGGTS
jgi:prevent-host-death family protein